MLEEIFKVLVNSLKHTNSGSAVKNILMVKDNFPNFSDAQQLIILQQLSILYQDIRLSEDKSNIEPIISSTIDAIAENISDDFLLRAFGRDSGTAMNQGV